jgi:Ca2+-binding EF-hand superfamily protein
MPQTQRRKRPGLAFVFPEGRRERALALQKEKTMTALLKTGAAVAALFAATIGTAVMAERGPGGPGNMMLEMFDTIDADKDGKLTEAELAAHRVAEFAAADTDKSGTLSAEELTAKHLARMTDIAAERTTRMIGQMDDNGDGALSADEMAQTVEGRRFARIDSDDDGAISKTEAEAALERFAEGRKHRRDGKHGMDN